MRRWLDGPGSAHFRALGNAPRMSLTCPLRVPVSLTCPLRVPVSLTCPLRVPYESKFVCPSYVPRMSLVCPFVCPVTCPIIFTCPESVGTYEAPPSVAALSEPATTNGPPATSVARGGAQRAVSEQGHLRIGRSAQSMSTGHDDRRWRVGAENQNRRRPVAGGQRYIHVSMCVYIST